MNNLSIKLGNRLAKNGITTRKSSIRLATETGKVLSEKVVVGEKNITAADMTAALEKVLPTCLYPSVLTKKEDMIPYLINSGYSKKQAKDLIDTMQYMASCVPNGNDISPIFVPNSETDDINVALFAHELEHSLERNSVLKRKRIKFEEKVMTLFFRIFDKKGKFAKQRLEIAEMLNYISSQIQYSLGLFLKFGNNTNAKKQIIDCHPDKESIYKCLGFSDEMAKQKMTEILRSFVDCNAHGKYNNAIFRFLKNIFSDEIAAYTAGGNVHEEIIRNPEVTVAQTLRSIIYKDMIEIIKEDKKTYRKNRIRGNLKPQHIFFEENDIMKLAKNDAEKKYLLEIMPKIRESHKRDLYNYMIIKPDYLEVFIKNIENSDYKYISDLKSSDGVPVYKQAGDILVQASEEKLKEFAKIADEKTKKGEYKYQYAAFTINHPRFDLIKEIVDIEINGENPYLMIADLAMLSEEELKMVHDEAVKAKAENRNIFPELYSFVLSVISEKNKNEMIKLLFGVYE